MPDPDGQLQNRDLADKIITDRVMDDNITIAGTFTADILQNGTSGTRIKLSGQTMRVYTGADFEDEPALIWALIVGSSTGATRRLRTSIEAPTLSGVAGGGTRITLNSESTDDSTLPPTWRFVYDGASVQAPEMQLDADVIIGWGSNHDDTIYSPADSQLAMGIAGTQELFLSATTFQVPNVYNSTDAGAANVTVTAAGSLRRNASALQYKPGWSYTTGLADRDLPHPIRWPVGDGEQIGYGAEHVAAVLPEAAAHEQYHLAGIVAVLQDKLERLESRIEGGE